MKYCIDCTKDTVNNTLTIAGVWGIKNILFIANETQRKLICAPFQKANVTVTAGSTTTVISFATTVCALATNDEITFMIDDFKSADDITTAFNDNIGGKGVGDMTVRQLLTAIQTNALTATQLNAVQTAITNLIGTASDGSTAATLFGKIAASKEVLDLFAYGYSIEANEDGQDTYTLNLDQSAAINGQVLTLNGN